MNRYTFEELTVGQTESYSVTVTEDMLAHFLTITGDCNPLHNDAEFAKKKGYPGRVAYGMLTASFLSTLAGVYLPGENSLIHSVETKFVKPVFVGDTLLVSGEVAEKNEHFPVIKLKVVITNQKKEKVLRGSMQIGVLKDGE